jgi:DNA-binding response OmpR family regulator
MGTDAVAVRVLIAEDEPSIATSLEFLMRRCGYDTRLASDGAAALDEVARFAPDLVILDVMLPKASGLDVCRGIRANPKWDSVRVLMLTARGGMQDMDRGLGAGADDYVVKPFATQDLVSRVKALLP